MEHESKNPLHKGRKRQLAAGETSSSEPLRVTKKAKQSKSEKLVSRTTTTTCPSDEPWPADLAKFRAESLHTPQDRTLTLAPSTLSDPDAGIDAGVGVFALSSFKTGQPITEYTGEILPYNVARERELKHSAAASHMRGLAPLRWVIDGKYTEQGVEIKGPLAERFDKGVAAFVNDPLDDDLVNARSVWMQSDLVKDPFKLGCHERIVYLEALKPIKKGEEIFASYGEDYWAKFDVDTDE